MSAFQAFGDPKRFEIAIKLIGDREPRERLPDHGGWSMGELRLTVGQHCLTQNLMDGENHHAIRWYLLPIFEWLARNWQHLLHEERFSWRENSSAPAATATFYALRKLITATDDSGVAECQKIQEWRERHALRHADSSALLPDLYFRRLGNDVELSWTARQPAFAPEGFRLELSPGTALMPVEDIASPLWRALNWFCENAPDDMGQNDRQSVNRLRSIIDFNRIKSASDFERTYLSEQIAPKIQRVAHRFPDDTTVMLQNVPVATCFSDYVLMYGGVSPNIGQQDFTTLADFMVNSTGQSESPTLTKFVDTNIGSPGQTPYEEGYNLAEDLLESMKLDNSEEFIDIKEILHRFDVHISIRTLNTDSIRGVALAGKNYRPSILINKNSNYNHNEEGQRFTLAHEFFHILFDRTRAKRIAHTSGAWARPGVEKRANAFAAMFLMPRSLVYRHIGNNEPDLTIVQQAANTMHVGVSALVEHLYNMNMIDEGQREALRNQITSTPRH
ncbi:MAG: ImmA/IrrE family metallo-endopeptidase [Magnetospirillum gryphiswaldense]|nr:ImmA/IrrE family metallo-endopeptidase [Magnetospirillum gryphiswaldense]